MNLSCYWFYRHIIFLQFNFYEFYYGDLFQMTSVRIL